MAREAGILSRRPRRAGRVGRGGGSEGLRRLGDPQGKSLRRRPLEKRREYVSFGYQKRILLFCRGYGPDAGYHPPRGAAAARGGKKSGSRPSADRTCAVVETRISKGPPDQ